MLPLTFGDEENVSMPSKRVFVNFYYKYDKDLLANQSFIMDAYKRFSLQFIEKELSGTYF